MPIETAKCLWGVDLSRAVSATVAATYPELGITEFVTTTSRVEGKFFKVSASGFHYSAPTIKMKLTQSPIAQEPPKEPVVVTTPAQLDKPVASASKKSTISCVKGKTIKKVTAVKPKCPAGFKKK